MKLTTIALSVILSIAVFGVVETSAKSKSVRVNVTSNGYTPKAIKVTKGEKLTLVFFRKDANNCGGEIVFPELNIRKTLPVGKKVSITIVPSESGEFSFTCGMGMLHGKIIVS
jgi:plastocyanin domain-containing protein